MVLYGALSTFLFHTYRMFPHHSAAAIRREVNLRDREATLLEREAILARQQVEQLIREVALQEREDLDRHSPVPRPHTAAEW